MSNRPPAGSDISTYSVSETGVTGDSMPHALPTSTRTLACSLSSSGMAGLPVCVKLGSVSSRGLGMPAQSCNPWVRRRMLRNSGGVRSECPMQLVEHGLRVLLEVRKLLDVLALLPHRHEISALDMHAVPSWSHLQLHAGEPQVLYRSGCPDAAVSHIGGRLAIPFRIGVVES